MSLVSSSTAVSSTNHVTISMPSTPPTMPDDTLGCIRRIETHVPKIFGLTDLGSGAILGGVSLYAGYPTVAIVSFSLFAVKGLGSYVYLTRNTPKRELEDDLANNQKVLGKEETAFNKDTIQLGSGVGNLHSTTTELGNLVDKEKQQVDQIEKKEKEVDKTTQELANASNTIIADAIQIKDNEEEEKATDKLLKGTDDGLIKDAHTIDGEEADLDKTLAKLTNALNQLDAQKSGSIALGVLNDKENQTIKHEEEVLEAQYTKMGKLVAQANQIVETAKEVLAKAKFYSIFDSLFVYPDFATLVDDFQNRKIAELTKKDS